MKKKIIAVLLTAALLFTTFGGALSSFAVMENYTLTVNGIKYTPSQISTLPAGITLYVGDAGAELVLSDFSGGSIAWESSYANTMLLVTLKGENHLDGGPIRKGIEFWYGALANLDHGGKLHIRGEENSSLSIQLNSSVVDQGAESVAALYAASYVYLQDNVHLSVTVGTSTPANSDNALQMVRGGLIVNGKNVQMDFCLNSLNTVQNFVVATGLVMIGQDPYIQVSVNSGDTQNIDPFPSALSYSDTFCGNVYFQIKNVVPYYWNLKETFSPALENVSVYTSANRHVVIGSQDAGAPVKNFSLRWISLCFPYPLVGEAFQTSYSLNSFTAEVIWKDAQGKLLPADAVMQAGVSGYTAEIYPIPTAGYRFQHSELADFDWDFQFAESCSVKDGVITLKFPAAYDAAPVIVKEPSDAVMNNGNPVTYTVQAQNAMEYQWIEDWDGGSRACWYDEDYQGGKTDTLTVKRVVHYEDYPADFSGFSCGVYAFGYKEVYTKHVDIDYNFTAPSVIQQPESVVAARGDYVDFTVEAKNVSSYHWQYSSNDGETWQNCTDWTMANPTTKTLTVFMENSYLETYRFRCVLTDAFGGTITTAEAFACKPVKIVTQPEDALGKAGDTIVFKTSAICGAMNESIYKGMTYQWQMSVNGGKSWTSLKDGSYSAGTKTEKWTYTLQRGEIPAVYDENIQIRCLVTNRGLAQTATDAVRIYKPTAPVITQQPEDALLLITKENHIGFYAVSATVNADFAKSYAWYVLDENGEAKALENTTNSGEIWVFGSKTKTVGILLTEETKNLLENGMQVYCVISNNAGKGDTVSETVTLKIHEVKVPVITEQPRSAEVKVGETAVFQVQATGEDLTYQWQYSHDGGTIWQNWEEDETSTGSQTDKLQTTTPTEVSILLRCVVSNPGGDAASDEVSLTSYIPHEHAFAIQHDGANHWYACTCGETKDTAAHTASGWITKTPAQIGVPGEKYKECTVCGYVMETAEIPALTEEHQHKAVGDWRSDSENHWKECECGLKMESAAHTASGWIVDKAAAVGVPGSRHQECTVCHFVLKTEEIPALSEPDSTEPDDPTKPDDPTEPLPTGKLGDVNGDGKINSADARIVLRIAAKLDAIENYDSDAFRRADVKKDGKINSSDARIVLRVAAKLETLD